MVLRAKRMQIYANVGEKDQTDVSLQGFDHAKRCKTLRHPRLLSLIIVLLLLALPRL